MDNLNTTASPHLKDRKGWVVLFLRWFLGGVVGFISGLSLLIINFVTGPLCPVGFILLGQYVLFENLIYTILYDKFISRTLHHMSASLVSLLIYSVFWGAIGALLASGRKKQIIVGTILLILYILLGYWSLMIYGSRLIPT